MTTWGIWGNQASVSRVMQTKQADNFPGPSAHTGSATCELSEAESGSLSIYASWGTGKFRGKCKAEQ